MRNPNKAPISLSLIIPWGLFLVSVISLVFVISHHSSYRKSIEGNLSVSSGERRMMDNGKGLMPGGDDFMGGGSSQASSSRSKNAMAALDPSEELAKEAEVKLEDQLDASVERVLEMYEPLFASMQLSALDREKLTDKLIYIEEARALMMNKKTEIESFRRQYDEHLKNSLSQEQYEEYRDIEASRIPERLVAEIVDFGSQNQLSSLSGSEVTALGQKLVDIGAKADLDDSFGPYGGDPILAVGVDSIRELNLDQIAKMQNEKKALDEAGLLLDPISQFYNSRIADAENRISEAVRLREQLDQNVSGR